MAYFIGNNVIEKQEGCMEKFLVFLLCLPLVVLTTFQGPLIQNASMVEETITLALYEGQKEAALQGRYDNEIYNQIKDYLVELHHYDRDSIEVKGTETLTARGEEMRISITVPKPQTNVLEMFQFSNDKPFTKEKYIMSEYR
ncbi:hypothetical protein ACWCQ1_51330 [Streptomyces sp. NPDC002144]|uniref:hypothetical protein n=2 Tax=cellular organisms TaxID=131567 RepID=UPI0036C1EE0F